MFHAMYTLDPCLIWYAANRYANVALKFKLFARLLNLVVYGASDHCIIRAVMVIHAMKSQLLTELLMYSR